MERDEITPFGTSGRDEERGAGGKVRRPPPWKPPATPYARPPEAAQRRWISKLVDPACRLIAGGATRIFPSFFSKTASASAIAGPACAEEDQGLVVFLFSIRLLAFPSVCHPRLLFFHEWFTDFHLLGLGLFFFDKLRGLALPMTYLFWIFFLASFKILLVSFTFSVRVIWVCYSSECTFTYWCVNQDFPQFQLFLWRSTKFA